MLNPIPEELSLPVVLEKARVGLMSTPELMRLYETAEKCRGEGVFVEVGSYRGTSALVILAGCRAGGGDARLYCIDTFEKRTLEEFDRNLGPYIKNGEVIPLAGRSVEVVQNWPPDRKIKFLFLDSDHTYRSTKEEIIRFVPLLSNDAVVLFHDCFYRAEQVRKVTEIYFWNRGVSQAVRELIVEDPKFGEFERVETLLVAKYSAAGQAVYTKSQRIQFRRDFEQATALNTWRLRLGFGLFVAAVCAKRCTDRLGLSKLARGLLRRLGVRTLFKKV